MTPQPLRPTDRRVDQELVRVAIGKGCELALTPLEYANAIARGKRLRRREQFRQRITTTNNPQQKESTPCLLV